MPSNNKPQKYRLKNANASTLAMLLRMNAIGRLKKASAKEKAAVIAKPVRKRIRGNVFDDNDGTDKLGVDEETAEKIVLNKIDIWIMEG